MEKKIDKKECGPLGTFIKYKMTLIWILLENCRVNQCRQNHKTNSIQNLYG